MSTHSLPLINNKTLAREIMQEKETKHKSQQEENVQTAGFHI